MCLSLHKSKVGVVKIFRVEMSLVFALEWTQEWG